MQKRQPTKFEWTGLVLSMCLSVVAIWTPSPTEAAVRVAEGGELSAEILTPTKPLRFGKTAAIPVEIKNASPTSLAVTFDDALVSYSFTFDSSHSITSDGAVEGGNIDQNDHSDGCPGTIGTYLLQPGHTIVRLVGVRVPKKSVGRPTLNIVLRVQHVTDPPHCKPATPLEVSASAVVKIVE